MGSSFSIENDTKEIYWVTHYNCQAALWGSIGGLLLATGIGLAGGAASASAAAGTVNSSIEACLVLNFELLYCIRDFASFY